MDTMHMTHAEVAGKEGGIPVEKEQHAFVMLGQKTLFLAHLTMFHMEEHMFQVVLRASLPDEAMKTFRKDQQAHPNETYFLGNTTTDEFTVPSIKNGRTSFTADVWRGIPYKKHYDYWPWRDERPILSQVTVTIDRIVYYRHFDFNLNYPQSLTYFLFGDGDEAHMNHYQVKEPDFDHTVSLRKAPDWLPPEDLQAGVHVNFPDLRKTPPVYCENPIPAGTYQVQYAGQAELHPLEVGQTWWCSTKVVNANDPCPA
ncbi:MAG TPA: hypothetical protein VKT72_00100 [Candidatus Baltobacteraceae bacterium]|nr:hypothetical protein [Candidatus Baltobacteraceae bacterium]